MKRRHFSNEFFIFFTIDNRKLESRMDEDSNNIIETILDVINNEANISLSQMSQQFTNQRVCSLFRDDRYCIWNHRLRPIWKNWILQTITNFWRNAQMSSNWTKSWCHWLLSTPIRRPSRTKRVLLPLWSTYFPFPPSFHCFSSF